MIASVKTCANTFQEVYCHSMKRSWRIACVFFVLFMSLLFLWRFRTKIQTEVWSELYDESDVPPAVDISPEELAKQPSAMEALGGYNVLIADRGNNRLIEVTPDKKIIWQHFFNVPAPGLGADDAFFTDGGKSVIVNLEEFQLIEIIDYASKATLWRYGIAGKPGKKDGELNTPDDAYKLPNGNVIVADIRNCRVIEITPDKRIIHSYGVAKMCDDKPGHLNKPNGDTPLKNGHILISNIVGHTLVEIDENWHPVFTMVLPVQYPSDPQMTKAGNILVADYSTPGKIVEVTKSGEIVWEYAGESGRAMNKPSLAIELPNGNILANDDFNHRVIVIDKATKHIIWQYGVTKKPGKAPGQLNIPDGIDIIRHASEPLSAPVLSIGQVTWHPKDFLGHNVRLQGYVLKKDSDSPIFSDEAVGALHKRDLAVTGFGLDKLKTHQRYLLEGVLTQSATKQAPTFYRLELVEPPQAIFP